MIFRSTGPCSVQHWDHLGLLVFQKILPVLWKSNSSVIICMSQLTHGKQCRKPQCLYLGAAGKCLFKLQTSCRSQYCTCILQDMSLVNVWNNFCGFTYVGAFFTSVIPHFFPPLYLTSKHQTWYCHKNANPSLWQWRQQVKQITLKEIASPTSPNTNFLPKSPFFPQVQGPVGISYQQEILHG